VMDEDRRLEDRAAIHDLLARLALAQDERDWNTLAGCFATDATYAYPGGELVGVPAIVGRSRTGLTPLDASQHLIGTVLVTFADRNATATSYFQAQHVRHGVPGGDLYTIAGTYLDELMYGGDGVWRIAHRTQEYSWRSGNPEVTRRAPKPEGSRTPKRDWSND
jgi:SnoaL-like domain